MIGREYIFNQSTPKFGRISNSIEILSVGRAPGPHIQPDKPDTYVSPSPFYTPSDCNPSPLTSPSPIISHSLLPQHFLPALSLLSIYIPSSRTDFCRTPTPHSTTHHHHPTPPTPPTPHPHLHTPPILCPPLSSTFHEPTLSWPPLRVSITSWLSTALVSSFGEIPPLWHYLIGGGGGMYFTRMLTRPKQPVGHHKVTSQGTAHIFTLVNLLSPRHNGRRIFPLMKSFVVWFHWSLSIIYVHSDIRCNLNRNTVIFMKKYTFENVACKLVAIVFQPKCV